ncbi:16S rRNA (guanine(966)-N(2))-methyltransferase |uniref:16S rRNA (Guanine(966)-N(2))-methyltransferase \
MAKFKLVTKIIAGKYKGKILKLPNLEVTRSSKSILKESFFNVLQLDIVDTIFIEAFGGSGSIGLEALSRGSSEVFFCEINSQSYAILEQNCKEINRSSCTVMFGDTFEKIPTLIQSLINKKENIIIYIDPPFDFRDDMDDVYTKAYELVSNIKNNNVSLIVFEHISGLNLPSTLGKFKKFKNKKFGKSSLTYYNA